MTRTIRNGVTGDKIEFLSSPLLGDGEELVFRNTLPPFAAGAPAHVHARMTESFEVVSGLLEIDLGQGRTGLLGPGETMSFDPETPHGFRNPSPRESVVIMRATPGRELERFLRTMYELANQGLTGPTGAPRNPLVLAAVLDRADMIMVGAPRGLQRLVVGTLAAFARRTGVAARVARLIETGAA